MAVEEQFYLVGPILLVFLLRWIKNKRELLLGAPLAMIWTPWKALQASGRGRLEILGWTGFVTLLILYKCLNEFRTLLYRGGFLLTALASALLILGASSPVTSLSKVLENRILRWIGTRSYSIYLWHWPVFILTRPGIDIQLPAIPVRLIQLAMTFGLAELSYRWIETPIRRYGFRASVDIWRRIFRGWPNFRKFGVGAGSLSASVFVIWQGFLPFTESSAVNIHARSGASVAAGNLSTTAAKPTHSNAPGITSTIIEPVIPATSYKRSNPRL